MSNGHSTCCVDGCDRVRSESAGLCYYHFKAAQPPCSISGCWRPAYRLGKCNTHYRHADGRDIRVFEAEEKWAFIEAAAVATEDACIEWPWNMTRGYGRFGSNGRHATHLVHKLVMFTAFGPPNDSKVQVNHTCHNTKCCSVKHLYYGTQRQNMQDMADAGRSARGERATTSKLTSNDVREIRRLTMDSNLTNCELGSRFGVSQGTISRIVNRLRWRHID